MARVGPQRHRKEEEEEEEEDPIINLEGILKKRHLDFVLSSLT